MNEPLATPTRTRPRRAIRWAAACAAIAAVGVALLIAVGVLRRKSAEERSVHDVPLGVEEAVIIRYGGPRLVARPYRRGASVIVRVAEEVQQDALRVYDVRYLVNVPGEFNLTDYLASADGSPTGDLPSFKVCGQTQLTKDIETRIREIEDVGVNIWHWYDETLVGLGVFWGLWLCGLIWIGRPKRPPRPVPLPPEPSLGEQILRSFAMLVRADLSVADKARLEIMLLSYWRQRLGLREDRMAAACRQIQRDGTVGRAYTAVEAWLHDPSATVGPADVLEICTPLVER